MSTNKFKDIKFDENLIAQVYDTNSIDNTIFPTPASNELQFGVGIATEDKTLKTHIHKVVKREIFNTSEFLFVISGLMTIEIYHDDETVVETVYLKPGMALLQFTGGHSIKLAKGTKYFEIKQGPYLGQTADKYFLEE
jgi:hypothetical protein